MLRYVKLDPTTQIVNSFCCSRVVFSEVQIKVPDLSLLFDNEYIDRTFKRYRRNPNEYTDILASNCGRCEGYGFYDWVTRLTTTDDEEEPIYNRGMAKDAMVVKNENPITKVYLSKGSFRDSYCYVSDFKPNPLTYQCEQCLGTGLAFHHPLEELIPITLDTLPEKPKAIEVFKSSTLTSLKNIFRRILHGTQIQDKNYSQEI